jgi:hypothetical protein
MKIYMLFVIAVIASGCTTAGPFVTNISSDGNGNLIIEKQKVLLNSFTGTVSNTDTDVTFITVIPNDSAGNIAAMLEERRLQREAEAKAHRQRVKEIIDSERKRR